DCYYRFDSNFVSRNQSQAPSNSSASVNDNNLSSIQGYPSAHVACYGSQNSDTSQDFYSYPDSGATHHLTNDLNNLNMASGYGGSERVQIASGVGMHIAHLGNSLLKCPISSHPHTFLLNNLMHVPHITKNLISVSKFAKDNS
ncbi:Unknown protein, partial [Striga hermonthica]